MAKVFKTGNSLVVTIPANFAKNLGIKVRDEVKVQTKADKGLLIYKFSGASQLPLLENFGVKRKKKK